MYYRDKFEHNAPHLHVRYQEHWGVIRIPDGTILAGFLPAAVERRVRDWILGNEGALLDRWSRAVEGKAIKPVD